MATGQGIDLWIQQNHLIDVLSFIIGSTLGLGTVHSLVPSHPAVLGMYFHSWNGPQVKLDIGWTFSHILFYYYPGTSCK